MSQFNGCGVMTPSTQRSVPCKSHFHRASRSARGVVFLCHYVQVTAEQPPQKTRVFSMMEAKRESDRHRGKTRVGAPVSGQTLIPCWHVLTGFFPGDQWVTNSACLLIQPAVYICLFTGLRSAFLAQILTVVFCFVSRTASMFVTAAPRTNTTGKICLFVL